MKIAVLGTRGIPTKQGGVERHVEELYQRLAKNHDVTVYCRNGYTPEELKEYKGIKLRHLPNLDTKHLDAITHTLLAASDAVFRDFDIIHFHAIGPSLLSFIPKIKRKSKVVSTVHAFDWQRDKWGSLAKTILKLGEKASSTFPNATIAVSKEIQRYLKKKYNRQTEYIPNGINKPIFKEPKEIKKFSLEKQGYILFLGRLVPEKNCHLLIKAYRSLETDLKLVIAGDPGHADDYYKKLINMTMEDKRIVFTGMVTGDLLYELYTNAYMFVLPSNLEGLPVALLESLSYGLPTLCSDIQPNIEIVGLDGKYANTFISNDLDNLSLELSAMLINQNRIREKTKNAQEYIIKNFNWDKIAEKTEELYKSFF